MSTAERKAVAEKEVEDWTAEMSDEKAVEVSRPVDSFGFEEVLRSPEYWLTFWLS